MPPSGEDFFWDKTSVCIFLLLWLLGLGIWFYQKKLKPFTSNFSKLMDLEKVATTTTNPIENIEKDKQSAQENVAPAWTASKVRLKSGQELPVGRSFKGDFDL